MLERLNADLRQALMEGIESGESIPEEVIYKELTSRSTEPAASKSKLATKPRRRPSSWWPALVVNLFALREWFMAPDTYQRLPTESANA